MTPRVVFYDIGLGGGRRQWAVGDLLGVIFVRLAVGFKLIREKLPENNRYSL
ncbi:hypothetical protein NST48_01165 [Paenibacillus sp. FSL M7-0547]|uniref:hypothetical protein n=1 Tax=Paenibacillus sp. FSL M7-0547 TaxID=2954755 RepID=UPI0015BFE16D